MPESLALPVTEPSQAGETRRVAAAMAARAGLDSMTQGRIALIVTELANNLVRHAQGGQLILRVLGTEPPTGMELLAIDRGPGIADIRRCLTDGYSTGGTPGDGLGAISRQSDLFEIVSTPGQGTVLVSRVESRGGVAQPSARVDLGVVCCPIPGETKCGDGWRIVETGPDRTVVMVADGLGHGPLAAEASRAALGVLDPRLRAGPTDLLRLAHDAMRGTRGAAVAVAVIDHLLREVRYAGVGNIAGTILGPQGRTGLVSHSGILGAEARKFQEFQAPWPSTATLVMNSDGLATQWRIDPGTLQARRHPALVAGLLYRDYSRGRDDVTVVVLRDGAEDPGEPRP